MRSRLRFCLILGALFFVTNSISAQKHIEAYDPEALFNEGVLLFKNQEYGAALSAFTQYRAQASDAKSQRCVDAQYYEAVRVALGRVTPISCTPTTCSKTRNTRTPWLFMRRRMLSPSPPMRRSSCSSIWAMPISRLATWIKPCRSFMA